MLKRWIIWGSLLTAGMVVVVVVAKVVVLPRVVRAQVAAGLSAVGVDSIDDLSIEYSLHDLWTGRIDHLVMRGGRFVIRKNEGRIQFGAIGAKSAKPQAAGALPVRRVEVQGAHVQFVSGGTSIDVAVNGTMVVNGSMLDLKLQGDQGSLDVSGQWNILTGAGELHATLDASSATKGIGVAIVLTSGSAMDKLSVHKGVFQVDGKFGETGSTLRIKLDGIELEETGNDLVVEGAAGMVELSSLSPLATPADQKLTATSVKIGDTALTDGSVTFRAEKGAALVRETRWKWLGGEVAARDFRVAAGEPVRVMLEAKELSLKEVLGTFAQGKVEGDGKLSGQLPLEMSGAGVKFGEGTLEALGTGQVKIVDASLAEPVAEAAAQSVGQAAQGQVKRNIMEALRDFHFDSLTTKLQQEPRGLVAYVHLIGKGSTGARQGLDYDLRINGLDELLASVLKIRAAMQRIGN